MACFRFSKPNMRTYTNLSPSCNLGGLMTGSLCEYTYIRTCTVHTYVHTYVLYIVQCLCYRKISCFGICPSLPLSLPYLPASPISLPPSLPPLSPSLPPSLIHLPPSSLYVRTYVCKCAHMNDCSLYVRLCLCTCTPTYAYTHTSGTHTGCETTIE